MADTVINRVGGYFKSALNTVRSEFSPLFLAAGFLAKGAQGLQLLTIDNPVLKMALSVGTFMKAFFESIPAIYQAIDIKKLRSDLLPHLEEPGANASREMRIARLTEACNFIVENKKRIQTTLKIDKSARLTERAEWAKLDLEKGEEFLRRLRVRVNQKSVTDTAQVISKTFSLTVTAMLIPMPTNPVLLGLGGVAGLSILGLWGVEKVLYTKDPFRPAEDIWYNKLSANIASAAARVQEMFTIRLNKKFA